MSATWCRHASARGKLPPWLGFDNQEQIRLATATSEMARNAFRYARGGKVTFAVQTGRTQTLEIVISDSGPGITNLNEIFEGRYRSDTGWVWALWGPSG